jgi:acetylornithine aminotransferase/acetylornithine/N-succinyldiaminopimelate aminotransferase
MNDPEQSHYLISNYAPPALEIVRGKGSYLWDSSGNKFLDFTSGIAVSNIGHGHEHWINSINEQVTELVHCSNLFSIPQQVRLAKRLVNKIGPGKMLFCNSGAEANEALIKFARLVGNQNPSLKKYKLIVAENAFHGRTMGALSATSSPKYRDGFEPLLDGFSFAPLNDLSAFEEKIDDQTVGVMVESIQGEGGIRVADDNFLQGLEDICREKGILFMLDEVQAGIGRTGEFLGYQKSGVKPDAIAIAKGLGGGFPIGGIWLSDQWADIFKPGSHGTTFGGSPLACCAGNAVLDVLEQDNLILAAREKGEFLEAELHKLKNQYPSIIKEVRGRGLMLALVMSAPPSELIAQFRQNGMLVVGAAENVIRFLPPLTVSKDELSEAMEKTSISLKSFYQESEK